MRECGAVEFSFDGQTNEMVDDIRIVGTTYVLRAPSTTKFP